MSASRRPIAAFACAAVVILSARFLSAAPSPVMVSSMSASASVPALAVLTLEEAYTRALEQSERLSIQEEVIVQAEALSRRTLGSILPDLRWHYTRTIQEDVTRPSDSGSNRNLTLHDREESRFTLQQPLFRGFREFRTLKGLKAQRRGQEAALKRAQALLYQDVAVAYYTIVLLEADRADFKVVLDVTNDRLKELRERVRLGKSRESEVASIESQYFETQADIAEKDGQIAVARNLLSFFIGADIRQTPLEDRLGAPVAPATERDALLKAQNRSDLRALREFVEARRYAVAAERSLRWPGADFTGNYYTKRTGSQQDIDWDMIFDVDVPIFQGGIVSANILFAKSEMRQAQLELSRAERDAEREIASNYAALAASTSRAQYLKDAFDRARKSYLSQVREYRLGLVNNLDVLQALRTLENVKANFNRATVQQKLDWVRLSVAMEEKP